MNILNTLQEILLRDYKIPRERLEPQAQLGELGIDSLGQLELMFKIEDHFHVKIPGDPPAGLATIQDVCTYIEELLAGRPTVGAGAADSRFKP